MDCAVDFLPSHIIEFTNLLTRSDWYTGSAICSRFAICPFLGIVPQSFGVPGRRRLCVGWGYLRLWPLGPVLRTSLLAIGNANRIQRAADYVVTDSRKVLHTAATDQHNRVLLQVVTNPRNVSRHFDAVGQAHARNLAQRGVRLLRRLGVHARAHAALLRTGLQGGAGRLVLRRRPSLAHQLIECRHSVQLLALKGHGFSRAAQLASFSTAPRGL